MAVSDERPTLDYQPPADQLNQRADDPPREPRWLSRLCWFPPALAVTAALAMSIFDGDQISAEPRSRTLRIVWSWLWPFAFWWYLLLTMIRIFLGVLR